MSYRLDPAEAIVKLVMIDGTTLSVKVADIINYSTEERNRTYFCYLNSFKSTFTVGEESYSINDVYEISIPFGFTHLGVDFDKDKKIQSYDFTDARDLFFPTQVMGNNQSVTKVTLGSGATLVSQTFRNSKILKTLIIADGATVTIPDVDILFDCYGATDLIIGKGANVTILDSWFFRNSSGERLIVGEGATVVFGDNIFKDETSLTTVELGKGTYSFGASSFRNTGISSLIIPEGSSVTFTGNEAFHSCANLQSVFIPSGTTTIPKNTFYNCSALTNVYLMSVTSIGDSAFYTSADTAPLNIYHHSSTAFTYSSSSFNGRTTNGIVLYTVSPMTSITGVPYVIYSGVPHIQTAHTENQTCTEDGYIGYITDCACGSIYYDVTYSKTTAEGTTEGGTYASKTIIPSYGGHDYVVVIVYPEGFLKDGTKSSACSRCKEKEYADTTALAIFKPVGFSYKLSGDKGGLSAGLDVQTKALNEYIEANKDTTTIYLTLFIVNPTYIDKTGAFFDGTDVNATKGVVEVDISDIKYSSISCAVNGFDMSDERYTELELIIGAYITKTVTDGDNTETTIEIIQKDYSEEDSTPVKNSYEFTDYTLYSITVLTVKTPTAVEQSTQQPTE